MKTKDIIDLKKGISNLGKDFRKIVIADIVPDYLYHYTSIEGFKGIIDSKEVWATAAHCLFSDPTEITIAKEITLKMLEKRKKDFSKRGIYDIWLEAIENWVKMKKDTFIFSLSEKEDLLSQWRAYCPKGGVSIGFSFPKISGNTQNHSIQSGSSPNYHVHEKFLYKCIYSEQKQKDKINEMFDLFLSKKYLGITPDFFKGPIWNAIRFFSYSFKHKSFEEEQEWRLCCFPYPDGGQLKYRVKDSILIPYIPFLTTDSNGHSIIKTIKIGPSRDKENLKTNILSYLTTSGYKPGYDINVSVTETPYQNLK